MKNIITIISILLLTATQHYTFAQAGSLDLSFGTNGKASTALSSSGHSYSTATAIQSDGKIIAAGYTYVGNNIDFAIARYHTNGSLDNSFDSDGKVTTDLGDTVDFCYGVAIQSDGKIVVTGGTANFAKVALVRYNTNGSLDSTFDNDGISIISFAGLSMQGYAVTIQNDNKILIAAQTFNSVNYDFSVIRLNTNGSLDATFDNDGIVYTNIVGDDLVYAIALQTDGKIVVAGSSNSDYSAVRYNTDGSLDITFDGDGKVRTTVTNADDMATCLTIQSDGRIVLGGNTTAAGNIHALVRYNTNGSVDSTFDADGIVLTSNIASIFGLKTQSDGKLIAAGSFPGGSHMDFVVIRYNTNGSLDLSFDTDGVASTDFGISKDDFAYATSIQSDGKIVVVGYGYNTSFINFLVVRYNPGIVNNISNVSERSFNVFPNPTNALLNIPNQINDFTIKIMNGMGENVYSENCQANKTVLDIQNLPKGIYILLLQSNGQTYATQFVRE
jgi:uncharacterized delta-60 repeat protein